MCGRFAITLPPDAMRRLFDFVEQPNFPPRYNIAPSQPIPIIFEAAREGRRTRHFRLVRWGLLPGFVKEPKGFPLLFNARAEGLGEKASFRNALRRRRCVVPADAFYEWHRDGRDAGRPFLCRRADGLTMALAGLWETWMGPNGEEVDTACIVTTAANALSSTIHPRLPAILKPRDVATWLDPDEAATPAAAALLRSAGDEVLTIQPLGTAVNKVDNDRPDVMEPTGPPLAPAAAMAPPPAAQPDLFG